METKNEINTKTTITCPECGKSKEEEMPTDACQFFYECKNCHEVIKPKKGDCCVFCSYATVPCPPMQKGEDCCGG
ncbi:MAG: GDCCVxC domain-containing (seleno)protein [Flavobacteriales bacterium]